MLELKQFNKRATLPGSIICENGCLRLRVVRHGKSLGIMLEAENTAAHGIALLYMPDNSNTPMDAITHKAENLRYVSFDPIEIHGETRGVCLSGYWQGKEVTLTAFLSEQGTWARFLFAAPNATTNAANLAHRWQIIREAFSPDVCWPREPVYQQALTGNPAAFYQMGPVFAALVADQEEGELCQLGLSLSDAEYPGLSYGIQSPAAHAVTMEHGAHFAYAICLDTHAVPAYGYQQILRFLGNHEALPPIPWEIAPPICGELPALPPVPDDTAWLPFSREGSPPEIAALVRDQLRKAGRMNWQLLECALQWLDRLCLHQRLCEIPGGDRFGGFGETQAWSSVAVWMPHLLLEAFRLTGNPEYAFRGMAALSALTPAQQSVVLGNLYPQFGDIFINADQGAAVFFKYLPHFHSRITPNGIILEVANGSLSRPLQLVMEGAHDCYQLEVNGKSFGFLPTSVLRHGIALPV